MTSVLFHFGEVPSLVDRLAPLLDGLDVNWCEEGDEERFADLLPTTDVLWHVLRPITERDMDRAPRLRLIQKLGSGVNTVDFDAARDRRIAVANMPGANAPAVAEATIALILATLRSVVPLDKATRAGRGWPLDSSVLDRVGEFGSRTLGLIGYGNVARRVETVALALGAGVLHTTRADDETAGWRPLEALLEELDVVSLHLPLSESTHRLIGTQRLSLLPLGAIFINTSRGPIVDEDALIDALESGRLAGAGLDVFGVEPVDPSNRLLKMDQVVLSPHSAWLTPETMQRSVAIAADNARRIATGEPLLNQVSKTPV